MESNGMMKRRVLTRFLASVFLMTALFVAFVVAMELSGAGTFLLGFIDEVTGYIGVAALLADNSGTLLFILYIVFLFITSYSTISRAQNYLNMIYVQSEKVLVNDDEIDTLPNELKDIEVRLKDIKYTVFRNERLAKEAEQRKNDLVVYLAHDLKTPLTSVIGYLSLLDECPELPVKMRAKYTSIALDKAYRLEQLINEFFDITRFNLQTIILENNRIDLSMMLSQMLEEFYPILAEKKLYPKTNIEPGIKMIGDADKLARVFDNILRNAVSYSYPNTNVYIEAHQEEEFVQVTFRNTGDEIPAGKLESIFEKFFRVDASRSTKTGGAGLGLAIAKQIVELHGGVITATSNREYTEFTVKLPKTSMPQES